MGSRGNIRITQPWSPESIYLYTHGNGHKICELLVRGLRMAVGRLEDPSYATRIIFDELTECSHTQNGYSIAIGRPDDNEYPIPEVSWNDNWDMNITYESENYTPEEFMAKFGNECTHDWQYIAEPFSETMKCVHCGETQR